MSKSSLFCSITLLVLLNYFENCKFFATTLTHLSYTNYFTGSAIDCFKCMSINNDYPPCEDPFHNNYTNDIFQSPCMGGRKGRDGLFPATACVKITGVFGNINFPLHGVSKFIKKMFYI